MSELTYRRVGRGPSLVFVHGYLGGAAIWQDQIAHYADDFDVIAPDLAGFGESVELVAPNRIATHARDVLDLLDRLGVDRFALVGHSMGGMVVQEMAVHAPERIDRLVLYGTGPLGAMPDRFEPIAVSRQRLIAEGVAANAQRIAATWFLHGVDAPAYPSCAALGEGVSLQTALASLDAMEAWDGREGLARIAAPTLVLWGDRDRSYCWEQPEALWRGINDCRLGVVPDSAHNIHLEKVGIFHALLDDFLLGSQTRNQ